MSIVKGLQDVLKSIADSRDRYQDALRAALYQEGLDIMSRSVQMVPVDTGRLRSTHYVAPPGEDNVCELGYGTDYALPVHDRVDIPHTTGEALYLLTPFSEAMAGYVDRLARRTQQNFEERVSVRGVQRGAPTRPKDVSGKPPRKRKATRGQRVRRYKGGSK